MTCTRCGRAANDAYLCNTCVRNWRAKLREALRFAANAGEYRARLGTTWRFGSGSRSAVTPLPYDPRITPLVRRLRTLLSALPGGKAAGTYPAAPELAEATHQLVEDMQRVIDSPPELVYLGACECGQSLYFEEASWVTCPRCNQQVDVEARRVVLTAQLHDYLATIAEVSRLLRVTLGQHISEQGVRRLVEKGVLVEKGKRVNYDALGRPRSSAVYRIGDVLQAVADKEYAERNRRAS